MSDLPNSPETPNAEATPLAHRFDATYPEVPPVPSATSFEQQVSPPDVGPDAGPPETVVAAGSALAVAALAAQAARAEQSADDDQPVEEPESFDQPAEEEFPPAEDEAVEQPGALAGASPGDSEAIMALLEAEAAAEFDVQAAIPAAEIAEFEEAPVAEEDLLPAEAEALPASESAAPPPPDLPEMDTSPPAEPVAEPVAEPEAGAIPEFVRLEPPEVAMPEDMMDEAGDADAAVAAGAADAAVAADEEAEVDAAMAAGAAIATATTGAADSALADHPAAPVEVPPTPPAPAVPAESSVGPAESPVGPHFRTDVCPRCGQLDFSKGTVLSYGRDFRPAYYKPAGLSWRRLRSMLRPFRHLVEVEAQVCRHCGLVSLQVDTDALRRIEEKYGG
ncbi:MAG: hypothetical protein JXN59_14240 [Anaerolineae bacterium]|nr:hypothetical protein [Anaerolineae bacterium]